ncbi:MAG: glycosyltransferase family 2 protein [Acidimicrobiia bacterium]
MEDELVRLLGVEVGLLPPADVITVIATYRRPVQLQAAVASALAQTYDDHRVVVVDDGGGLREPLPSDPRLSVIKLPRNVGVAGVVRNVAIRLSSSRLVAFLDDDNVWEANHLALAVAQHDEHVAVTYSQVRRVDGEGNLVDYLGAPFDRSALRQRPLTDTNALVVRRDRHVRFSRVPRGREDFPAEDWELLWRLSRRGDVRFIPQVTVTYVQHGGSYYSVWGAA